MSTQPTFYEHDSGLLVPGSFLPPNHTAPRAGQASAEYGFDVRQLPAARKAVTRTPAELHRQFDEAEYWATHNPFVRAVLKTRRGFQNYRFSLYDEEGELLNDKENPSSFWKENGSAVKAYVRSCWKEWNIFRNAVAYWRTSVPTKRPLLLPLRLLEYRDPMGVETLKYAHGLNPAEAKAQSDPRFRKSSVVELSSDAGDGFQVLKEAKVGDGFGSPNLVSIFNTCQQIERLQGSDNVLAEVAKVVIQQHKLGHEIKAGQWAGMSTHFAKKNRIQIVREKFAGKDGHINFASNFDHEVIFNYLSSEAFDKKKYEGAETWMLMWSFPIGQMLQAKGSSAPFLMPMLAQQIDDEREILGEFIAQSIAQMFELNQRLTVRWSDLCFKDSREAAAILRYAHKAGPLSSKTFLRTQGFDPEVEAANKAAERQSPEDYLPLWDPDHGRSPEDGQNPVGRPPES